MAWYNFWKSEEGKIEDSLEQIERYESAVSRGAGREATMALKAREGQLNEEIETALAKGTSAQTIIELYSGDNKAAFEERVNTIADRSEGKIAEGFDKNIEKIEKLTAKLEENVAKLESGELLPAQEASIKDLVERQSERLEKLTTNVETSNLPVPEDKETILADAKQAIKTENTVAQQLDGEAQAREQANKINNPLVPPANANEAAAVEAAEQKQNENPKQNTPAAQTGTIAFDPSVVNEDVRKIQGFVGAGADGRLGEETLAKVNEFMDLEGDAKFTKETGIDGDAVLARIEAIQNEPAFQKMKEAGFSKDVVAAVQNELGLSEGAKRGNTIGAMSIDEIDDLIQARDVQNLPDAREKLEKAAGIGG